jgi:hypothetical protein
MTTTTLEEMEFALARIDLMLGMLKRQVEQGTNAHADMARYQEWRDDLDVEIALEQIKLGTYRRRRHHRLYS